MNPQYIPLLIFTCLGFVYALFMLMYLHNASKCDRYMSQRDVNFRKVAYVITWIDLILIALMVIAYFTGIFMPAENTYALTTSVN